jgi:hypothetical protein
METNVNTVLAEREGTHGSFAANAKCSQELKAVMLHHGDDILTAVQREALDNIAQKISRILTGNANHVDSWVDIAGYATLVARALTNGDS